MVENAASLGSAVDVAAVGAAYAKLGAACVMILSALGSSLGTGVAGPGAIGAWKKCFVQKKPAPFQLLVFAGAPLSQTIYGMILMFLINGKAAEAGANGIMYLWVGIFGGTAMGVSAWMQGRASAAACDAFAETGKGFANDLMIIGMVETCALFILAFLISVL